MNVTKLLRNPMKVKPASNRAARKHSSSTPADVIRLSFNESQYGMSPKAKEVFLKSLNDAKYYPDFFAIELKHAIADFYGISWDNVVNGAGSSALIDMLGEVFINEGDEILFCDPTYEAYRDLANDFGAVAVTVPLNDMMAYDLEAMNDAITDKTKMIVIVNPNNPTGGFVESSKVEAFIRNVPEDIMVVVDEAYLEYADVPDCYSMIKLIKEGYEKPLVVLKTFSKIYGMAGVRVGFAACAGEIFDQLSKSTHAWNVGNTAQAAAIAALQDVEYTASVRKKAIEGRNYLEKELAAMGCEVFPSQASFVYFNPPIPVAELSKKLAERKINISTFAYSRVSTGTMEQNKIFIKNMKEILAESAVCRNSTSISVGMKKIAVSK